MQTEYESSRIERAKRGLYGTDQHQGMLPNMDLSPSDIDVANDWGDTEIITEREVKKHTKGVKFLKYLVIVAILTVCSSAAYLLYQMFDPFSKPSDKNIEITFDIPLGVNPGAPADIVVHINNHNRVALDYANFTLVYPPGTKNSDNAEKELREVKKVLGVIPAGGTVEFPTRAIFLGEENVDKELRALLEYRFANVNSMFNKEVTQTLQLLSSPINLTVDLLKQINAGQEVEIGITAASNTSIPLNDVLVSIEYPQGFAYSDASPKPTFGNTMWKIGKMEPAGKYAFKIRGVISGEDTQEKVFKTKIGVGNDQTEREIRVVYANVLSSTIIQKPFIGIKLLLGNKPLEQAVAHFGGGITGTVMWTNNLSTKVLNMQLEVKLFGAALDRSSVSSNTGFFRSSDDTIIWDERGSADLADIEAGGFGEVNFSFSPLPSVSGNQLLTNPTITAQVTARGKRISESGVPEEIKTVITQNVKISTETQFKPWLVYSTGPFVNTGPIPPRVEQETSYTIWWSVRNTSNAIANAEVRGVLPQYVKWAGSVSPTDAPISYDEISHQVVWKAGDIPAGAGNGNIPPKEVAFQLIFTPSLTQVKTSPFLLNDIQFIGVDSFTGETFRQEKGNIGPALLTDPRAPKDSGVVVQ